MKEFVGLEEEGVEKKKKEGGRKESQSDSDGIHRLRGEERSLFDPWISFQKPEVFLGKGQKGGEKGGKFSPP